VRRQVVLADVRLDLDDPCDAVVTRRRAIADEPRSDQAGSGLEGRAVEELSEAVQWVA
jgi:hypothetical protein